MDIATSCHALPGCVPLHHGHLPILGGLDQTSPERQPFLLQFSVRPRDPCRCEGDELRPTEEREGMTCIRNGLRQCDDGCRRDARPTTRDEPMVHVRIL